MVCVLRRVTYLRDVMLDTSFQRKGVFITGAFVSWCCKDLSVDCFELSRTLEEAIEMALLAAFKSAATCLLLTVFLSTPSSCTSKYCPVLSLDGKPLLSTTHNQTGAPSDSGAQCALQCYTWQHWCKGFTYEPSSGDCFLHQATVSKTSAFFDAAASASSYNVSFVRGVVSFVFCSLLHRSSTCSLIAGGNF